MGFSGIGWGEILVILIVALLVLGPNRIPEIGRTLGKTVRAIRKASTDLTTSLSRELEAEKKETPPATEAGKDKAPAAAPKAAAPEQNVQPKEPGEASQTK